MNSGNVREVWTSGRLCDKEVDGCEADRYSSHLIWPKKNGTKKETTTGILLIICSESMERLQARQFQLLENQIWLKPQRQPQSRVARPFVISSPPGYLITSPWRRNFPTDNCLERPITPTIWHFKYNKRSHFCCFQVPALQHPRMVLGLQPPVDGRDQRVQWAQGGRSLSSFLFCVLFWNSELLYIIIMYNNAVLNECSTKGYKGQSWANSVLKTKSKYEYYW